MTPDPTPPGGYHTHKRYEKHDPLERGRRPDDVKGLASTRLPRKFILALMILVLSSALFVFSYAAIGRSATEGCLRDQAEALVLVEILERAGERTELLHEEGLLDDLEYTTARREVRRSLQRLMVPQC